jgi:hypothetical protein
MGRANSHADASCEPRSAYSRTNRMSSRSAIYIINARRSSKGDIYFQSPLLMATASGGALVLNDMFI